MPLEGFNSNGQRAQDDITGNNGQRVRERSPIRDHMRDHFTTAASSGLGSGESDRGSQPDQSSERVQPLDHSQETHNPADRSALPNDGDLLRPLTLADLQSYNQQLIRGILGSAAQHIERLLAGQPEEDRQQFASSLSQFIEQHIEQQRRDLADQSRQRHLSRIENWRRYHQELQNDRSITGLYQPIEREKMGKRITARKSLSEQPLETAEKLDRFLNLAFHSDYNDFTEKEQYIFNVADEAKDVIVEKELKESGLREDVFRRSRSAAMIGDIVQGQAVRAASGNTSVSDTVITEVERQSDKYETVKKSFWTTFQKRNRENHTLYKDMSANVEQIIHGLNTDDGKTRRDALGKWTKMYIEGELDKYQTDKTKNISDNFIKQLKMLAKLQEVGLLKQEAVTEKKRKLLIKGKIEPILEEVNRCIEWAKSIDPSIENQSE